MAVRSGSVFESDRSAADPDALSAHAVEVARVVVPLDGSPFAERALPVAGWAAAALGADVQLVEVVATDEEAERAMRYLDAVTHRDQSTSWHVLRGDDVAEALAGLVAGAPGRLACVATHGRDRSAALVGSVASSLLDRSAHPVLLAGPEARAVEAPDAPVVAAVDGTARDEALVPVALGWARRMARPLLIATVAEPAPRSYQSGGGERRARGPGDPERYVAELAARSAGAGVAVDARVIYDPISVCDGLVPMVDRVAALVVVGSRHRHGLPRMVLGSHAARIVHDASVPALAVPLPAVEGGRDDLREQVRARYAEAAQSVTAAQAAGRCGPSEGGSPRCGTGTTELGPGARLYDQAYREELPDAAVLASLGCGNPLVVADLHPGEVVLDLGSGGGIDVLLSARRVGPTGRAYGVDMTDEMLELARRNATDAGATNVEFLKGDIEDIPLPDESVDVVISNCVINLSVDKAAVFAEMRRVLRPGGRIGVTDIVADAQLDSAARAERGDWAACTAGALSESEYRQGLAIAGFTDIDVTFTHEVTDGMRSAVVRAVKPG